MRTIFSFCFSVSFFLAFGQQPFNYGQNRNVYFISSELRKKWGIERVYLARQEKEEKTNLLYSCSFTPKQVITRTYIRYDERSFRFLIDSMLQKKYDMESSYYFNLEKGKARAFGSDGNGINDQHAVKRSSGTSLVESIKAGGGTAPRLNYTRNVFSPSGRLLYGVYYPVIPDSVLLKYSYNDSLKARGVNYLIRESIRRRVRPDTLRFQYNKKGQLTQAGDEPIDPANPVHYFIYDDDIDYALYSEQAYLNRKRMEAFFMEKAGYLPGLILIEVTPYCVMSFYLDPNTLSYYAGKSVNLEKMYNQGDRN